MTKELYIRAGILVGTLLTVGLLVTQGWLDSDWGNRIEGALGTLGIVASATPKAALPTKGG